jgi:hypothetical protein
MNDNEATVPQQIARLEAIAGTMRDDLWSKRHEDDVWLRLMMLLCRSGELYEPLPSFEFGDEFAIAVLRKWGQPYEDRGWGVFIGTEETYAFQPVSRRIVFEAAYEAREAVDTEGGRWMPSGEVVARPWEV